MNTELYNHLERIYYDVKNPSSFGGVSKLLNAAKTKFSNVTKEDIVKWLQSQRTYTLHKQRRKNFTRNRIIVEQIDQQWQADLVEMQEFSKENNGIRYIITIIDILSKYSFARPITSKTSRSIVDAFKDVFKYRKPIYLQTDKGREFLNKDFQTFLKQNGVHHFTTENSDIKCAVVERFNRTLKSRMFRYFTAKNTRKYIDILQSLVDGYNQSVHRTIKMKPIDVNETTQQLAFYNTYGTNNVRDLLQKHCKSKLNRGDTVKVQYELNPFDKSYYPLWTEEEFKIRKENRNQKPVYKLKDWSGENIKGSFYLEELQKVIPDSKYKIEKILRRRGKGKHIEYFVKWLGYPDSFNSWIPSLTLTTNKQASQAD